MVDDIKQESVVKRRRALIVTAVEKQKSIVDSVERRPGSADGARRPRRRDELAGPFESSHIEAVHVGSTRGLVATSENVNAIVDDGRRHGGARQRARTGSRDGRPASRFQVKANQLKMQTKEKVPFNIALYMSEVTLFRANVT